MESEARRTLAIFLALAALVGAVAIWWSARQARAPQLVAVRVVFAWEGSGVATDRPALVPAGQDVTAYAVVSFRRGQRGPLRHLCAHPRVELHGEALPVEPPSAWPSSGGVLRALWMTVEPEFPGWAEVSPREAHRLEYKEFLAPEWGRELSARVDWRAYSDAFLTKRLAGLALPGGPVRVKVRVAAYADEFDLVPAQWVSSPGAEEVFAGGVATVVRDVPLPGLDGRRAAPFLRLSCFTFAAGVWPDGGADWPLPFTPRELIARRAIVTPETFAAAMVTGDPLATPWQAPRRLVAEADRFVATPGKPLEWGREVAAGDALRRGAVYFVLVGDDGDGVLSLRDQVAFAWMQPGYVAPLGIALESLATEVELLRRRPGEEKP